MLEGHSKIIQRCKTNSGAHVSEDSSKLAVQQSSLPVAFLQQYCCKVSENLFSPNALNPNNCLKQNSSMFKLLNTTCENYTNVWDLLKGRTYREMARRKMLNTATPCDLVVSKVHAVSQPRRTSIQTKIWVVELRYSGRTRYECNFTNVFSAFLSRSRQISVKYLYYLPYITIHKHPHASFDVFATSVEITSLHDRRTIHPNNLRSFVTLLHVIHSSNMVLKYCAP